MDAIYMSVNIYCYIAKFNYYKCQLINNAEVFSEHSATWYFIYAFYISDAWNLFLDKLIDKSKLCNPTDTNQRAKFDFPDHIYLKKFPFGIAF